MRAKDDLTLTEKALIKFMLTEIGVSWKDIFLQLHPEQEQSSALSAKVSKFKLKAAVQRYYDEVKFKLRKYEEDLKDQERQRISSEKANEEKKNKKSGGDVFGNFDFTNRDEFLNYLNKAANNIKDERDKREYLKMISDNLRFKEPDKHENTEIQRFYTPLQCKDCILYQRKKDLLSTV